MVPEEECPGYQAIVHKSLLEVIRLLGVAKEWVLGNIFVAVIAIAFFHAYAFPIVSALVHVILLFLTRDDPHRLSVLVRYLLYRAYYGYGAMSTRIHLGRELVWKHLVDPARGIHSTTDDGVFCVLRVEPIDVSQLSEAEQGAVSLRLNEAFKRLGEGWAVWAHTRRREVTTYPTSFWADPISALLDEEAEADLTRAGRRWTDTIYITLQHSPDTSVASMFEHLFFVQPDGATAAIKNHLDDVFEPAVQQVMDQLSMVAKSVQRLNGDQLRAYLKSWISIHDQPDAIPGEPTDTSYRIVDSGYYHSTRPALGTEEDQQYLRAVCLTEDLPATTHTMLFDDLFRLPFAFDVTTRHIPIPRAVAQNKDTTKQLDLHGTQKGWKVWMYEYMGGGTSRQELADSYQQDLVQDSNVARHEMLSNLVTQGYLTMTFLVRPRGPVKTVEQRQALALRADEQISQIERLLHRHGCNPINEGLNLTDAFFGMLPGHRQRYVPNPRQLLLNTLNFAHLMPWHRPWQGSQHVPHLQGPALTQAITQECMPFGINPYVGDVANQMKVGPLGSGKSTQMNWEDLQWLRYPGARLRKSDYDASSWCMTLCLGGEFRDLMRGEHQMQVLARLDHPEHRLYIYQWVLNRIREADIVTDADVQAYVWDAMMEIVKNTQIPRYLTSLMEQFQGRARAAETLSGTKRDASGISRGDAKLERAAALWKRMGNALRPFCQGGPYGHILDARIGVTALPRVFVTEKARLSRVADVYPAVMEQLYLEMWLECDGHPTRMSIDEAWHSVTNPTLVKILAKDMPGWRKNNFHGIFATQSIDQLQGTALTPLLLDNAKTRCFYPNPQAMDPDIRKFYEAIGLTATQIHQIAYSRPGHEMLYVKPEGSALVNVRLQPIARDICGANGRAVSTQIERLLEEYGCEEFPFRWLAFKGHHEAAQRVRRALATRSLDAPLQPVLELLSAN
jgi:type IV secretory pathway VirB4 component/type IV secretory pathway TrbD component